MEVDDGEDISEEAKRLRRVRKIASAPTEADRTEHERTHLPYRSWRPFSVARRGTADPHVRSKDDEERTIPGALRLLLYAETSWR